MKKFVLLGTMVALVVAPTLLDAAEVKDPNPPAPGQIGTVARATGGPDTFGYTFADGAEPGVTFDWIDITGTGTALGGGDDDAYPVTLGADFNFYGVTISSLAMATNGFLNTDPADGGGDLSNDCPLPSTPSTGGGARIYPLHDDLTATEMYYEYFAVCPRQNERCAMAENCSIFLWDGMNHWGGTSDWQMEVVIYHQTNDVVAQIGAGNAELGSGSTTGLQNEAADDGLTYACDTDSSIPDDTVVQFYHPNDITAYCQPAPAEQVPTINTTGIALFVTLLVIAAFVAIRQRF